MGGFVVKKSGAAGSLSPPGTPTLNISILSDMFDGSHSMRLPLTTAGYLTSTAWTALLVATFDAAGSDNTPSGGGQRCPIVDADGYWGIGIGNTSIVAWQYDNAYKAVTVAATTGVKYGILAVMGSGTLTLTVSEASPSSLGSIGTMGSTASAVDLGINASAEYFDGRLWRCVLWASALSSGDQTLAQAYATATEGVTW
jgi:hypothetical protein